MGDEVGGTHRVCGWRHRPFTDCPQDDSDGGP